MTRSEHIRALLEEYAQQRAQDEADQRARLVEACNRMPRIDKLRRQSANLAFASMGIILAKSTEEERVAAAENMKQQGQAINAEIRALLKEAGFPENYLQKRYRCDKCKDTGYVGDAPSRFCDCFEARLRLRQHEDGSMAGVDEQNFAAFREDFIPEEGSQRERMHELRVFCEAYADEFPNTRYRNLLMTGAGGLGKTFLLNCIFERVTARGFSAVRVTAFHLFEQMRKQHLSNDPAFDGFTSLMEAPLLLIDDLGSEPMMKNITVEYLFMLLNERAAGKKHTVVATNLSPGQLNAVYGERVASRLLDRTCWAALRFEGKDLRKL